MSGFESMIEIMVPLMSALTAVLAILNYSLLLGKGVDTLLNYKIRELFYILIVMLILFAIKAIFGCKLLTGIVDSSHTIKLLTTFAMSTYFFGYNLGLMVMLITQGFRPIITREVMNFVLYTMVLYLFVDKVSLSSYVDIMSYVFIITLIYVLFRIKIYLKILNLLIEPVDVIKPTQIFVISTYITAIACMIGDLDIAKSLFLLAMAKAIISFIHFDVEIRKVSKI
jgi:hypothetical protein